MSIIEKDEAIEGPSSEGKAIDLEVKDAQLIFDAVWSDIEREFGAENLRFPKEIFWLNGAPGAGKGTQTRFVMEFRDLTAPPIVVSSLLKSDYAKKLIDAGMMVGDREVTGLVFRELLNPDCLSGVVVDGYPRTKVQVLCLKLLFQKLRELYKEAIRTPLVEPPKSIFHIIVLFVDESESVRRQLKRGRGIVKHNEAVKKSGMGELVEVRKTDLSREAARKRYLTFKNITYESLKTLQEVFQYHYVDAHGRVEEVQKRIIEELRYQSSLELNEETFKLLAPVPLANQIVIHSRQELVNRLDEYERFHNELFKRVIDVIQNKFMPIIRRHSISGIAYINSEDEVFNESVALYMFIDVFSERGYRAAVDVRHYDVADRIDPKSYKVINKKKRVYRFSIRFPGADIRKNQAALGEGIGH